MNPPTWLDERGHSGEKNGSLHGVPLEIVRPFDRRAE
jgi:hypothetical protein